MNSQFKIHWFALFAGILSGFGGGLIAGKCYSFGSFIIGMIFSYIIGFSYSKYCELRAKRRNKALPDNIRLVFDRWTGNSEHGQPRAVRTLWVGWVERSAAHHDLPR